MDKKIIEVVAGVLTRPDGSYMLGSRPEGKPYAGYWEFPGGKVEPGESFLQALERELSEEMGIRMTRASYWQTREHHYEHASVRLRFFRVWDWQGEPSPLEGQSFAWVAPDAAGQVAPMLPANGPILKALTLPSEALLTCSDLTSAEQVLQRLSMAASPLLVVVSEPGMSDLQLQAFCREVCARVHAHGGIVLVDADPQLPDADWLVDGVFLNPERLMRVQQRPPFEWVGTRVETDEHLSMAGKLALDFAVLPLAMRVDGQADWAGFSSILMQGVPLPVYAQTDACALEMSRMQGAHGVARLCGALP